jgi:hypothetical protein
LSKPKSRRVARRSVASIATNGWTQMKDVEMILQVRDSKCWIEVKNFSGCYKCQSGAQLWYRCITDYERALAKVECEDGTLFIAKCSVNAIGVWSTAPQA